jgi:hypothetical protein
MQCLVAMVYLSRWRGAGMMRKHAPSLSAHAIDIGRNDWRNALAAADFDVLVDNQGDEIVLCIALHGFDRKAHVHAARKNLAPAMRDRIAAVQRWRHGMDAQDVIAGVPNAHHRFEIVLFESLIKRKLGFFWSCKQYELT